MRKAMLMMFLWCVSGTAVAAWEKFEVDGNGDSVYLDPTTIRRHGNIVRVYVVMDSKQTETAGTDKYQSAKAEIELDCANNLVRVAYLSLYTDKLASGVIIKFGKIDSELAPIEEESPSASLLTLACKQR